MGITPAIGVFFFETYGKALDVGLVAAEFAIAPVHVGVGVEVAFLEGEGC